MSKKPFDCTKCTGFCCSHPIIAISEKEAEQVAKHLGIQMSEMKKHYLDVVHDPKEPEYSIQHKPDYMHGSICKFYRPVAEGRDKPAGCTVYEARPEVCRKYPYRKTCGFYEFLSHHRESSDNDDLTIRIGFSDID